MAFSADIVQAAFSSAHTLLNPHNFCVVCFPFSRQGSQGGKADVCWQMSGVCSRTPGEESLGECVREFCTELVETILNCDSLHGATKLVCLGEKKFFDAACDQLTDL